ncbi:MAG: hypothetical protein ACLGI2_07620, partial [Acidimicrobiia bacterium]
ATVGTAPATTTTTDPYAVPAVIDEAYVNRVLAGLDAAVGDVVRLIMTTKTFPREGFERLKAVYGSDAQLNRRLDSLARDIAQGMPSYRGDPGDSRTTVAELLTANGACIFARISRDYSAVSTVSRPPDERQWVALIPLDRSRDPSGYNRTGWAYVYEGFEEGRLPPRRDPCLSA